MKKRGCFLDVDTFFLTPFASWFIIVVASWKSGCRFFVECTIAIRGCNYVLKILRSLNTCSFVPNIFVGVQI